VLILLPPSETKNTGGQNLTIEQVHLSYGQLNEARDQVLSALLSLCDDEPTAAKILKRSTKQVIEVAQNSRIKDTPTMAAYLRYGGTLYKAMDISSYGAKEISRLRSSVLIQSALFGLISATDLIPWYRLSATTALPGVSLKRVWREHTPSAYSRLVDTPIIDLRSRAYVDLSPIPLEIDSYWVDVVAEDSKGNRRALNHFNKTAKGEFTREFVKSEKVPSTMKQLEKISNKAGLGMEVDGKIIRLVTSEVVRTK
jgi:cytoplasmic iron level regulating protein YaaA (DUF328/UPF0246 family)